MDLVISNHNPKQKAENICGKYHRFSAFALSVMFMSCLDVPDDGVSWQEMFLH